MVPQAGLALLIGLIFNIFGAFVAFSQLAQMRRNYWYRKMLQEVQLLEEESARRMEGLTYNTVPKPVAEKMILQKDYSYAASYEPPPAPGQPGFN